MGAVGCDNPTHQRHICLFQAEKLLRTSKEKPRPGLNAFYVQ